MRSARMHSEHWGGLSPLARAGPDDPFMGSAWVLPGGVFHCYRGALCSHASFHNYCTLPAPSTWVLSWHHRATAREWGRGCVGNGRLFFLPSSRPLSVIRSSKHILWSLTWFLFLMTVLFCRGSCSIWCSCRKIGGGFYLAILLCLLPNPDNLNNIWHRVFIRPLYKLFRYVFVFILSVLAVFSG